MLVPAVTKYGTYIITIIILYCMDGTTYIAVVSKLTSLLLSTTSGCHFCITILKELESKLIIGDKTDSTMVLQCYRVNTCITMVTQYTHVTVEPHTSPQHSTYIRAHVCIHTIKMQFTVQPHTHHHGDTSTKILRTRNNHNKNYCVN